MAIQLHDIPPLDPNNFTGPARIQAGIGRTGDVVLDEFYGVDGAPEYATWLYVGGSGDVSYVKWDGTTQVLVALNGGEWHRIMSIKVNGGGTAATNIVWGS